MGSPISDELVNQGPFPVEAGSPHPLGATPSASGVNFSIASSNAAGVELLLFSAHDSLEPFQTIRFDPYVNKTFHIWHICGRPETRRALRVSCRWPD
jgi:isoamylase